MKPVAKGVTKKFIRIIEDKEAAITELKNSIDRTFTGRIQGILRTDKGELEVVIETLQGRIVAAGVEGYTRIDGGLALNTIVNAIVEGTGFLEILELDEEGVNLDLEFNPTAKLSMPTSLELYINRIELRLRQLQRKKEIQTSLTPSPLPHQRKPIEKPQKEETGKTGSSTETQQLARRKDIQLKKVEERKAPEKPRTEVKEKTIVSEKPQPPPEERKEKKILEEIGLDEEVLEGLVVNVKEKPPVIVALPSGAGNARVAQVATETGEPVIEKPVEEKPPIEELPVASRTEIEQKTPIKEITPSPEELLSKLPLSEKIEEYSKSLLSKTDKLLVSLIETSNVLSHGRDKVDVVFKKTIDLSKNTDKPIKLSMATAGKLYYIIIYNGSIVSAFKVDENSENIELYGRAVLVDLLKKIVSEDIDYVVSLVKNKYMLSGLGLIKKEELEQEVEERAEGLFGRLKKIFGGR